MNHSRPKYQQTIPNLRVSKTLSTEINLINLNIFHIFVIFLTKKKNKNWEPEKPERGKTLNIGKNIKRKKKFRFAHF